MEYIVVLTTVDERNKAEEIARKLLEKKLCACVQLVYNVSSFYVWKGETVCESEFLLLIKTKKLLFDDLKKEILSSHPYELPEIVALDINDGYEKYFNWIDESTKVE